MSLNLSNASSDFAEFVEGLENRDPNFDQVEIHPGEPARDLDSDQSSVLSLSDDEVNLRKNSSSTPTGANPDRPPRALRGSDLWSQPENMEISASDNEQDGVKRRPSPLPQPSQPEDMEISALDHEQDSVKRHPSPPKESVSDSSTLSPSDESELSSTDDEDESPQRRSSRNVPPKSPLLSDSSVLSSDDDDDEQTKRQSPPKPSVNSEESSDLSQSEDEDSTKRSSPSTVRPRNLEYRPPSSFKRVVFSEHVSFHGGESDADDEDEGDDGERKDGQQRRGSDGQQQDGGQQQHESDGQQKDDGQQQHESDGQQKDDGQQQQDDGQQQQDDGQQQCSYTKTPVSSTASSNYREYWFRLSNLWR